MPLKDCQDLLFKVGLPGTEKDQGSRLLQAERAEQAHEFKPVMALCAPRSKDVLQSLRR